MAFFMANQTTIYRSFPSHLVVDNSAAEVTEVARMVPSGKLLCNVTEHHNLEDYLQHVQTTADELRQQLQDKRVSWLYH